MNWIKQNQFLSGFIAFMVIGVGALGFLLFSAHSRYSEVRADYEAKASELNQLEGLKPYPEPENLKVIEAQKTQHAAAVEVLQKNVAAAQLPIEPMTREGFQDKLREAVTRITAKAKEGGLTLPPMFYLGMEKYQTEPPLPEAAPALGRQLKGLELVLSKMIDDKIVAITKFERDILPEEEGKGKKEKETPVKPAGPPSKSSKHSVSYNGVQIEFTAEQSRFMNFMNGIVAENTQFFVPRLVVVKNEKAEAPVRALPAAPDPIKPGEGQPKPEEVVKKLVFGSESVNVSIVLDIVDFAEVAAK